MPLIQQVFQYLNKHPNLTLIECTEVFKDEEMKNLRRCWHDWTRYVKPLHFLYFLLIEKFVQVEKITGKEKKKLREIEKRLDLR